MRTFAALFAGLLLGACATGDSCEKYLPVDGVAAKEPVRGVIVESPVDYRGVSLAFIECRARRGSQIAQFLLGRAYQTGTQVARDFGQAAKWYKRAAGPASNSQYTYAPPVGHGELGRLYEGTRDRPKRGYPPAQMALAELYLDGRGVKQDEAKAQQWLSRAARQGYEPAIALLDQLFGKSLVDAVNEG